MSKQYLISFFLNLLSGILFFLSFPKFGHGIFAWFCFVPSLLVLFYLKNTQVSLKKIFLLGVAFGIAGYCGLLYWIVPTFVVAGENVIFGVIAVILLSLYCSLYYSLFYIFSFYVQKINLFFYSLLLSCLWILLEYLKSFLFSGFPWMLLGYSQYENLKMIQIAEYFGVYGVSFILIFFNVFLTRALYELFLKKKFLEFIFRISLLSFFILLVNIYGHNRIKTINEKIKKINNKLTVAILQGNIDQYKKWDKQYIDYIMNTYSELVFLSHKEIEEKKHNLVLYIWPESSAPGCVLQEDYLYNWIVSLVKLTNTKKIISYHLVGSIRKGNKKDEYYNSAMLFEFKNSKVIVRQIYDKIHLVPFGEYVPLRSVLGKFISTVNELGEFTEGKRNVVFRLNAKEMRFSTLICYESVFPELTKKFVINGAKFLVNITNDAWFLKTSAPYQHFIFNIFRAIENRCYLIRAANTGISSIIYPTGYVYKKTNLFETTKIVDVINIYHEDTFYTKYGEYLWLMYLAGFLLLTIFLYKKT